MANDLIDITEAREFFGPLYMYILDENITDIDIKIVIISDEPAITEG